MNLVESWECDDRKELISGGCCFPSGSFEVVERSSGCQVRGVPDGESYVARGLSVIHG